MSNEAIASLQIDSDWATFQLITDGARVRMLDGHKYPPNVVFTESGLLYGQPNEQLQPGRVELPFVIFARDIRVTFFTGKGDTGTDGPRNGIVTASFASREYTNTSITGDGLNIKGFSDAPLRSM
ncbi:hypothetical protein OG21DRAFT_1483492 [Imleria badia]|nr:hypothetical protein OG21DRAFT_1483492 [Imleria badia]